MLANIVRDQRDLALLVLRIVFGVVFALYGWKHVQGLEGYTAFFGSLGVPAAGFVAPLVAWIEFLGGLAALAGVLTRYAGLLLACVMVVSSLTVKIPMVFGTDPATGAVRAEDLLGLTNSPGWNIDLSLFAMAVVLLLMGPGKFAIETALFKKEI